MDQKLIIGLRFKQIRESLRLSQIEFAGKVKVSHQTMVGKIERGEASPTIPVLQSASKLSGMSIDYILNGNQKPTPITITPDIGILREISRQLHFITTEVGEMKTEVGEIKTLVEPQSTAC